VTIFRGVSQDLGPIRLSEPDTTTDIEVADLPAYYQQQVRSTLSADDRAGAERIVAELRLLSLPPCDDVRLPTPTGEDLATATTAPGADDASATSLPGADDAVATTPPPSPLVPGEDCRP
jgi:hypothetical protein